MIRQYLLRKTSTPSNKERKILSRDSKNPMIKFTVSYRKTELLALQDTKCSLPPLSIKRIECSTHRRLCSSTWWIRHGNYSFIIPWSERATTRSLEILNGFQDGPQQRACFHPQLHKPHVLLALFDLPAAVYSAACSRFPPLEEPGYPKAISESQHGHKCLFWAAPLY